MVGRSFENKSLLPAIEQGVAGVALGGHLVAPAHDVERHEREELAREVVAHVMRHCSFARSGPHLKAW